MRHLVQEETTKYQFESNLYQNWILPYTKRTDGLSSPVPYSLPKNNMNTTLPLHQSQEFALKEILNVHQTHF